MTPRLHQGLKLLLYLSLHLQPEHFLLVEIRWLLPPGRKVLKGKRPEAIVSQACPFLEFFPEALPFQVYLRGQSCITRYLTSDLPKK